MHMYSPMHKPVIHLVYFTTGMYIVCVCDCNYASAALLRQSAHEICYMRIFFVFCICELVLMFTVTAWISQGWSPCDAVSESGENCVFSGYLFHGRKSHLYEFH